MLIQQSISDIEFNNKKRKTRKEVFLERMETLIPWEAFIALIEPAYPKEQTRKEVVAR
jgi:IS5 family transposase